MNKLLAAIKRSPKRSAAIAIIAAAILVPSALLAWGPDRPTFTMAHPAPYVTFNSITDNPQRGDERNFVSIKPDSAPNSAYSQNTALQPGQNYDVLVYYHNNAASNLNDAAHNYVGIAHGAFMRVQMPATVQAGQQARITAFVGATNANPTQVWSEAYGSAAGNYALTYVPGSATIYNWGGINGSKMPDSLYTTGAPLGYDKLDGTVPGCNNYSGYVIFQVHVDQPNFEIQKQVSKAGTNQYASQITAMPGDEVQYKIQYKDTGTTQQNNVVIKDALPAGVTYENGTTQIATSATGGKWVATNDGITSADGINIGSYIPGGNAYLKFTAKITSNDQLAQCGLNTLVNTATADTANGSKSSSANVIVTKTCVTPGNVQVCNPANGQIITVPVDQQNNYKPIGDVACQPSTPPTPTQLPHTGISDSIMPLVGIGSLVAAIGYYVASRRALN